jgi:hypothetical protein
MVEETTFEKLKKGLLELLRGYPSYRFFGKIEYYLKESKSSLEVLKEDKILEFASKKESKELNKKLTPEQWAMLKAEGKKEPIWYRLSSKGVDLAISLINLDHSEKMLSYTKETDFFNRLIIHLTKITLILTALTIIFGLAQLFLSYFQNPIPLI